MKQIVQCVPNFSEGRDEELIKKIIKPLQDRDGFTFISYEADKDYNRTVVTLIGDPKAMLKPLVEFFKQAVNLIDMRAHKGEHPRMGAIDVVPFIPISGIKMDECILIAKDLADAVSKLNIPVYLYAEAATSVARRSLPAIRQGEFEGLEAKMQDSSWLPDYGKACPHPSFGAVAIGARMPLVAYNIDLITKDELIANRIARAIRKSSGGFSYVQAGAAYLEERGHVQVTMNILDYKKNPLYRILELIKIEAKAYSVEVASSEVIGLIPKEALTLSLKYYFACNNILLSKDISLDDIGKYATKYLGLRAFSKDKIIESYLGEK